MLKAPTTVQPSATGLISQYSLSAYKQSKMYMWIDGITRGTLSVVRSGMIDIVILVDVGVANYGDEELAYWPAFHFPFFTLLLL